MVATRPLREPLKKGKGLGLSGKGKGSLLMNPLTGRPYTRGARERDVRDFYS